MRESSPRPRIRGTTIAAVAFAMLMIFPSFSASARADDIPHENYDLVQSNLDTVIALLNSSVLYSEAALTAMYEERMADVNQNLSVVRGIIKPAEQLVSQITLAADSFENLSKLVPPFASLSSQEDSFASMETSLLSARLNILAASEIANMTGDQLIAALESVQTFNSLVGSMNNTIDDMLGSAFGIIALKVGDLQPFTHNDLIPLIERLRELLHALELEINRIIHDDIHWGKTNPFLILSLDASEYHLGDVINGRGTLYFNGSFAAGNLVHINKDGANFTSCITSSDGDYTFQSTISINASLLGTHTMQAWANIPTGILWSNVVSFRIVLIRTTMTLASTTGLISREEPVSMTTELRDEDGKPLPGMNCNLTLDGTPGPFVTGAAGEFSNSWFGSDLGYGSHSFQAVFGGELPYGPSSSRVVVVVVDIPTSISLRLFSDRLRQDYSIIGNGTLYSNGTTPLPSMDITVSVDGHVMSNLTTDENGGFAFSIPADTLKRGGHVLRAEFLHKDMIWRYAKAEVSFTIISPKLAPYPFLPHIPGWGGMSPDQIIPYMFIGQYSYLTWLLLLLLVAITIRVYQMRAHRSSEKVRLARSEVLEPLGESAASAPTTAPTGDFWMDLGESAPRNPNDRIVWYYHGLLSFLRRRQSVTVASSMTHWEVAKMLDSLGYPFQYVQQATVLFERALYAGVELTDKDSVLMSTSLTYIVGGKLGGGQSAIPT